MQGQFVWYELITTDAAKAETFYRDVVGWGAQDSGQKTMTYTLLTAKDRPVAGLMTMPKEACDAGARPGWMGYVGVDDVDAMARKVVELGGKIHYGPENIPDVGRFATVADPQGAVFSLFKGSGEMPPLPARPEPPGYGTWRELMAGDWEKAFAFYAALFGWKKDMHVDMGPEGVYQTFGLGDTMIGGMMTKPATCPMPFWNYYFMVDGIRAALGRVKAAGGSIMVEPMEVPGGGWILQGTDPQGVIFALYSTNA